MPTMVLKTSFVSLINILTSSASWISIDSRTFAINVMTLVASSESACKPYRVTETFIQVVASGFERNIVTPLQQGPAHCFPSLQSIPLYKEDPICFVMMKSSIT
jgi:hypothetical protein